MCETPALSSLTSTCETTKATDLPSGAHCGSRTSLSRPRSSSDRGRLPPCADATPADARTTTSALRVRFIRFSNSPECLPLVGHDVLPLACVRARHHRDHRLGVAGVEDLVRHARLDEDEI